MKWLLGLLAVATTLVLAIGLAYRTDSQQRIEAVHARASMIETPLGAVEYRLEGTPGAPVLAFLHGSPGGQDQGPPADEGTRVLTMSRPGYLGTPLSSGATPGAQADLLAALLDALNIEQAGVIGVSGGGPAAFTFAARYPERTLALVALEAVADSMPIHPDDPTLPESDALLWMLLSVLTATQGHEGIVRTVSPNDPDLDRLIANPEALAEVADLVWTVWPPSLRGPGLNNDLEQFTRLELPLESIRAPTLIIHGTEDDSVPFAHAELLAARIPGARLHAIEGAGHMMPFAHREEMDRVMGEFLRGVLSTP